MVTWRMDLNRILHVFNVRSVTSARPSLTVPLQTELAINTHLAVSDIRRNVVNTHTIVSDVHHGVLDTHAIVSDIHRTVVKGREGADGKNRPVSVVCVCRWIIKTHLA